jgi:hypothetical protein
VDSIMMVGNKSKNLDAVHLIYFFLKFKSSWKFQVSKI